MVAAFTIDPKGQVTESSISKSDIKNPVMEECVLGVIRKTRFPETRNADTVHITYPFRFSVPDEESK